MKIRLLIWTGVLLMVTATARAQSAPAEAQNQMLGIVPPHEKPFGMSYEEWSAKWWQWLFSIDAANTPFNTWPTSGDCSTGQLGPVWFLVGFSPGPVTINCHIPAGKGLFFPVINNECSNLEQPPYYGKNPGQRRKCNEEDLEGAGDPGATLMMAATIDGHQVQNLKSYRAKSPNFIFVVPPNNILGVPAGMGESVADGFYLMLAPLSPGPHTIHFSGAADNKYLDPVFGGPFKIDTTYILAVN